MQLTVNDSAELLINETEKMYLECGRLLEEECVSNHRICSYLIKSLNLVDKNSTTPNKRTNTRSKLEVKQKGLAL